jgi:transcriptional regulator with XRE-family HTH domain
MAQMDTNLARILGTELRYLRRAAKRSQAAVAKRAGITQAALSNYETGKRVPTVDVFVRLVEACGDIPHLALVAVLVARDAEQKAEAA